MPTNSEHPQPIVPADFLDSARRVIRRAKQATRYPYFLDAKLGDADIAPVTDAELASAHNTPHSTLNRRVAQAINALATADQELAGPLAQVAQRANRLMAQAAIINRHIRRPPLYSEATLRTFLELGYAQPEHTPIIRAAGHVAPPPVIPADDDIGFIISDIAAHLTRCHTPQSSAQILDALHHRQDALNRWPKLDLTLFIRRVSGIAPDDRGQFNPDQPWANFVPRRRLVANTMFRILSRDGQPRTTQYLIDEIHRLVGSSLPDGYSLSEAVKYVASASDDISWQGLATFGLRQWDTDISALKQGRRGRTGDLVYAFLMEHGPADVDHVVRHVQRTVQAKTRTVTEAISHDPANRFLKLADGKVVINPIPQDHNPNWENLVVIPDDARRRPAPVLRESELAWLTHYLRALNALEPPLPLRVTISGRRAEGFALDTGISITVVGEERNRSALQTKLNQIAEATSDLVPSVPVAVSVVSPQEWERQQAGNEPESHYNVWLAPNIAAQEGS